MNPFINCLVAAVYLRKRRRGFNKKRYHIHPHIAQRALYGEFSTLFVMLRSDKEKFYNYFKMSVETYDELLSKLEDQLKHCSLYRKVISPNERLAVCLRFLATGNSYTDLHYMYRLGESTISKIISEVCTKIWDVFHDEVLKFPSSREDWLKIAEGFESQANFPNCVGAIDVKHVRIICPARSGSLLRNYKKHYSVVLLAMCDANYCFTYVDASGTDSDSTISTDTNLFYKLNADINLPEPRQLPNSSETFPFIIIGDSDFGISSHVLRPYAQSDMIYKNTIFNYRHGRARRHIESTLGIMSNKFEVFHRPLKTSMVNSIKIIKACCVLHNFIRVRDGYNVEDTMTIEGLENSYNLNNSFDSSDESLRDAFANYFISPAGSVPWQNQYIY